MSILTPTADGERYSTPSPATATGTLSTMRASNSVRRIRPDEGDVFRAIRLRALAEDPQAFGAILWSEEAFESEVRAGRAAEASDGGATAVFFYRER